MLGLKEFDNKGEECDELVEGVFMKNFFGRIEDELKLFSKREELRLLRQG